MKTTRKLHLWIGIITSLFILMESITGLLISEPWLIGASEMNRKGFPMQQMENGAATATASADAATIANAQTPTQSAAGQDSHAGANSGFRGERENQSSLMGIIRGLHEGKFSGANLKWIVDLTAISMIILTITGITLSLRVLRAQRNQRKKALANQEAISSQ
ncbi:PepSY-associated TM helix domain-containing protein [Brevibacillus fluminis]|uniref:PepSY-associated TM helix domain-containing protein n=1 Tax=Brevibacillus fluminis TaxID=511487 RepID=UPI003F8CD38B